MPSRNDYQELLTRYLTLEGGVLYAQWNACEGDVATLDDVLGHWCSESPDSSPTKFSNASARLSYWLNLYNALVIREVLRHWPLQSVRDVRPTLMSKVAPLKGFFKDLHFDVGGREMNLSDIENQVIRAQFKDARIHFALNCGSAACPILRKSVFSGESLEDQLNEAARAFVASPDNVRVDVGEKTVWLSKLFKWYADDFERHAKKERNNENSSVLDFVELFADPELRTLLGTATEKRYRVRFHDYDWSVNESEAPQ